MDVKTLLATIGHVAAATTLDIYSHVTDTIQMQAAVNIDRHIGKTDAQMPEVKQTLTATQNTPVNAPCEPTEANREPTPKRYAKLVRDACIKSTTTSGKQLLSAPAKRQTQEIQRLCSHPRRMRNQTRRDDRASQSRDRGRKNKTKKGRLVRAALDGWWGSNE